MKKLNLNFVGNKKAAMFGLDARIALAIFGALSVISGAALYSAIQQAKVEKWQTYFSDLSKASKAYYLDTGRQIPLAVNRFLADEFLFLSINDLVINEDNVAGWQGPYWQTTEHSTGIRDFYIKDNMTNTISSNAAILLWLRQTSNWTWNSEPSTNALCAADNTDCAEWWVINAKSGSENALKLFNLLDKKVDNGDGAYTGNIRYSPDSDGYLFVKGRPRVYRSF